jgi:hypothetical protein
MPHHARPGCDSFSLALAGSLAAMLMHAFGQACLTLEVADVDLRAERLPYLSSYTLCQRDFNHPAVLHWFPPPGTQPPCTQAMLAFTMAINRYVLWALRDSCIWHFHHCSQSVECGLCRSQSMSRAPHCFWAGWRGQLRRAPRCRWQVGWFILQVLYVGVYGMTPQTEGAKRVGASTCQTTRMHAIHHVLASRTTFYVPDSCTDPTTAQAGTELPCGPSV